MSESGKNVPGDHALGMDESITRRDFLGSALIASGATLLAGKSPAQMLGSPDEFTGYGGVGEYSNSNGNTLPVLQAGHTIRDGVYNSLPGDMVETGETYDCVVVGGGISGLAAGLFFQRQTGGTKRCLILENHPIFGGEAKQNEFLVDGKRLVVHQGSALFQLPYPYSFVAHFYDSIGLKTPRLQYQKWSGSDREMPLGQTPYQAVGMQNGQYGFWFGAKFGQKPGMWVTDPLGRNLQGAPIPDATRAELVRWLKGQPLPGDSFVAPQAEGDPAARYLDSITLEQHYMKRFGLSQETIRTFLCPMEGGAAGLGPDALSAYTDYMFNMLHPLPDPNGDQMFPGGNTTIARLMVKAMIPAAFDGAASVEDVSRNSVRFTALDGPESSVRIRLASTAVAVEHDGDPSKADAVKIVYLKDGKLYRVRARSVVMAGGSWTTKHIVRDLPETHRNAYGQFYRSPCMMANVAVRNWRFLYKMGMSGCRWFEGVGNYTEVHKLAVTGIDDATISPDSPIVLTLKVLYPYPGLSTQDQGNRGRWEMFSTSFRNYERAVREQLTAMFGSAGFNAQRDIAGIILNRWGHAYLSPQPGFFFGKDGQPAPRETLRRAPFGRITFANTDLAGAADHRYAILEARRAVGLIVDQVLQA